MYTKVFLIVLVVFAVVVCYELYIGKKEKREKSIQTTNNHSKNQGLIQRDEKSSGKIKSVHDLFIEEEEDVSHSEEVQDVTERKQLLSEKDKITPISEKYVIERYLFSELYNGIYIRLDDIFASDFVISPYIHIEDVIHATDEAKQISGHFDFVFTDSDTGLIRLIILLEESIKNNPDSEIIIELIEKEGLPYYRYNELSPPEESDLSETVYSLTEGGMNE